MRTFSLKWLLVAVAFVAVAIVALRNANRNWQSALESAALLLVLVAAAGTIWSAGKSRAFWGGYFLFGAISFVLATRLFTFTGNVKVFPERLLSSTHKRLVEAHTENFAGIDDLNQVIEQADADVLSQQTPLPNGTIPATIIRPGRSRFVSVAQALLCIPFGLLGGLIATTFYRRRTITSAQPLPPELSPSPRPSPVEGEGAEADG